MTPARASTTARSSIPRSRARLLGLALAAALWVVAPAVGSADEGAISIGLADESSANDDPRSRFYVVDVVEPGASLRREVRVGNATPVDRSIDVYVGDASVEDGGFHLESEPGELASWSSSEPTTLDIPAGASARATVSFAVPHDADDGERYGVIWAQPHGTDTQGVVNRVGVRVYLLVDADGASTTNLVVDTLRPRRDEDGRAEVVVAMSNVGARATDVHGELAIGDEHRGPLAERVTLAPGETRQATVTFAGDVPDGPWEAVLTLDVNGVEQQARATIEFPDGAGETGVQVEASTVEGSSPPAALVAVAGALAAVVLVATARTRLRRSEAS